MVQHTRHGSIYLSLFSLKNTKIFVCVCVGFVVVVVSVCVCVWVCLGARKNTSGGKYNYDFFLLVSVTASGHQIQWKRLWLQPEVELD